MRNSQLWRLVSRSFSTRFGSFLDERSSLGANSKRGCFPLEYRFENTHVEATLNHPFPALVDAVGVVDGQDDGDVRWVESTADAFSRSDFVVEHVAAIDVGSGGLFVRDCPGVRISNSIVRGYSRRFAAAY